MLGLLKRIFCKHDWEKMWIDRVWYSEEPDKKLNHGRLYGAGRRVLYSCIGGIGRGILG